MKTETLSYLDKKNIDILVSNIETYGFDVAFLRENFSAIKDPVFHKLRTNYLKSHNELHKYVLKMKKESKKG